MCDINKKTRRKTVTVYKVVIKKEGKYLAVFSKLPIKKGLVLKSFVSADDRHRVPSSYGFYNKNMVGRTSGFKNKTDALALANECRIFPEVHESYEPYEPTVLKMVLGGEIMQGTASKVSNVVPDKNKTFAGTEVLSFEEV